MKLSLIAVGRLKSGPETELAARYGERVAAVGRTLGFSPFTVVELPESRARRPEDRRREEAGAIVEAAAGQVLVAFDERGAGLTSEAFAGRLRDWRDGGSPGLACIVGGPDGLDASVRQRADLVLAFGALTMPHQIVRALVAEQLYRAMTILSGHPYHRA